MKTLAIPTEDTKKLKKLCNACPFSRSVTPGALGGSDPAVYIGQGHGPFWLPCHKNCDFNDPEWKTDTSVQQCAGAAIYRSNLNRENMMPKHLHKLPANSEYVFSTPAELYAHHKGISLEDAQEYLKRNPPNLLMMQEFHKVQNLQHG